MRRAIPTWPRPASTTASNTTQPPATFARHRPNLRHVHRRRQRSDPMDGQQRGAGQQRSASATTRTRPGGTATRHWIEIDQVAAANGSRQLQLEHRPASRRARIISAGYLWSDGTPYFSHLTQSITIKPAPCPIFGITAPTSGTFTAGQTVPITVDGRQCAGRQHDQPQLRSRHHVVERQRTLDRDRPGRGRQRHRHLQLEHHGRRAGQVLHGRLSVGRITQPTFSHVMSSITIQAPAAPRPSPYSSPTSGHSSPDRTCRSSGPPATWRRQHHLPLLRPRHHLVERQRALDRNRSGGGRQRQRQLHLEHHGRRSGHILRGRLPLVEQHTHVLPPHPVDHDHGRTPLTVDASLPPQGSAVAVERPATCPHCHRGRAAMGGCRRHSGSGLDGRREGRGRRPGRRALGRNLRQDDPHRSRCRRLRLVRRFHSAATTPSSPICSGRTPSAPVSGSPAANRVDLLTTVMHELGHVLGYRTLRFARRHVSNLAAGRATSPAEEHASACGGNFDGHDDNPFVELDAVEPDFCLKPRQRQKVVVEVMRTLKFQHAGVVKLALDRDRLPTRTALHANASSSLTPRCRSKPASIVRRSPAGDRRLHPLSHLSGRNRRKCKLSTRLLFGMLLS